MRPPRALLFAAFAGLSAASAFGAPAEIIIIRHGEKPAVGNTLDVRGLERSVALVDFFKNDPAVTRYGPPAAIYAMGPSAADYSLRPVQTVTPLAGTLGIPINDKYAKNDLSRLVSDVMRNPACDGKTALICWEHRVIPQIVKAFGFDPVPREWPGNVFDRVLILDFDGRKAAGFKNAPQHLLSGDNVE